MKNFIAFLFLGMSYYGFSQEKKITISCEGITSGINEIEGKSAKENYTAVLEWIIKTYKYPDYIIKTKIEDKYIRFSASDNYQAKNALSRTQLDYIVEIEFKENKFKVSFFDVIFNNGSKVPEGLYNKKGELRTNIYYITSHSEIERTLNEMNDKLVKVVSNNNDW